MRCYNICSSDTDTLKAFNLVAAIATNVSSTMYPIMQKALKSATTPSDNETIGAEFTFPGIYSSSTDAYENYTDDVLTSGGNFTEFVDVTQSSVYLEEETTEGDFTSVVNFPLTTPKSTGDDDDDEYYYYDDLTPKPPDTTTTSTTTTRKICKEVCNHIVPSDNLTTTIATIIDETSLNYSTRRRLRNLCWETMFGQELIKLTVMDLVMTVLSTLAMDFLRGIFVRVMNRCWCWDLEKKFPQYADFKVAENILHLVNNQGLVWMGMFFSPGLVVMNVAKLFIMMYFRAWIVLTCNVPHEIIFRASRSNNFYYALLLMMLFLSVLPVGYAIVRIPPSGNCGPFSNHQRIFHILTQTIKNNVPKIVRDVLDYIASPGIVIPLLLLLVLIIYYLVSLTSALREANVDLKVVLQAKKNTPKLCFFSRFNYDESVLKKDEKCFK